MNRSDTYRKKSKHTHKHTHNLSMENNTNKTPLCELFYPGKCEKNHPFERWRGLTNPERRGEPSPDDPGKIENCDRFPPRDFH